MNALGPGPFAIGLDLAKRVFQVHVALPDGTRIERKRLARADVLPYFEQLPPSLVGMEACSGAHHWAAAIRAQGHTVRMLNAIAVSRLRQQQKTDRNDAAAICLAVRLPELRSVPWKTPEQQAVLALHAMRDLVMANRIAASNQLLALLGEFGDVTWSGWSAIQAASETEVDARIASVPHAAAIGTRQLLTRLRYFAGQEFALELQIKQWHEGNQGSQLVATIPRVGFLGATAIVATMGADFEVFRSGRDVSAWIGLVPMQHSSGEKVRLGHIKKKGGGNRFMRKVLYKVAWFSILDVYKFHAGPRFLVEMLHRDKPQKVIAIAAANKLARTAWTMLKNRTPFEPRKGWERVPFEGRVPRQKVGEGRKDDSARLCSPIDVVGH